ncbi:hypothetical protein BSKO_11982 [Bryopsis sp. KO-2023]|nr:hypothetical protein BSKO_11982 [Bryopsis sp. KO-2023]
MEALKAELERKRKEKETQFGKKRYVKRGDLVQSKLKRLREEEQKELESKGKKQKSESEVAITNALNRRSSEEKLPDLSKEEAIRRLRALGQPATFFGEDDLDRVVRLVRAEKEMNVEDEAVGGQQVDSYLELRREEKERRNAANVQAAMDLGPKEDGNREVQDPAQSEDATLLQFQHAADRLAQKLEEEKLPVEDRIQRTLARFCDEWRDDLDARSTEASETRSGHQASMSFWQNMKWMEPLFERLKKRQLPDDTVAGLWMIVEAMKDRNYQYGYEVYLKLAIGNAPWPIGVTSVGIHERSAREKISHVRNLQGQAHIMNDEATRKYLQAIKRLMTFVQRAYPTEPSRSVDFNSVEDPGKGAAGGGSDKLALLSAEAAGVGPKHLSLAAAPHVLESDGSVKVPTRWENLLKRSEETLKKISQQQRESGQG